MNKMATKLHHWLKFDGEPSTLKPPGRWAQSKWYFPVYFGVIMVFTAVTNHYKVFPIFKHW
jgi:hypothetical protein